MNRTALIHTITAIFLWSTLALLGHKLKHLPPFFLVGISFMIGGLISIPFYSNWSKKWQIILVCVGGIFGYHFLLFSSFRLIPTITANLLNYLWPLLIVVLSPIILPNYKLQKQHVLGVGLGVIGTILLFIPFLSLSFGTGQETVISGCLLAISAALVWSSYSLVTKRLPTFSSATIGLCCIISGSISLLIHYLIEPVTTFHKMDVIYLVLLGIGPMGIAFYSWDFALKNGDPRIIGTLSYCTPLLSSLFLTIGSDQDITSYHIISMILIIGGAYVSSTRGERISL